jgi:hypothetical protein
MSGQGRIGILAAAALVVLALPLAAERPAGVARGIEAVSLGEPESFEGLTVIPLIGRPSSEAGRYATLEQALARGWLEIVEKDGGSVPEVWVSNRSDRTVFIMGGEILSGARQDRIVRRDLLVAPRRQKLAVPVYCVEEGRWHPVSGSFGSEKNLGTYKLRARAQKAGPEGQSRVWAEVAKANDEAGVSSSTGAYQEAYRDEKVERRVQELERRLGSLTGRHPLAVGVIVGVGESIVSLDLFADPYLFQELWPKILKSLALADRGGAPRVTRQQASVLLTLLAGADYRPLDALDQGSGFVFADERWDANALTLGDTLVHLAAFPWQPEAAGAGLERLDRAGPPLQRTSRE